MRKELRPVHDLVSCDLCHRTILKGERIETFVGGGDRQRVCELCNMRARRSGWLREAELERPAPGRERQRPRRSLWSRVVAWAEEQGLWGATPPEDGEETGERSGDRRPAPAADTAGMETAPPASVPPAPAPPAPREEEEEVAVDRDAGRGNGAEAARAEPGAEKVEQDGRAGRGDDVEDAAAVARRPARTPGTAGLRDLISGRRREPRPVHDVPTSRWGKIELALELFNGSEHRRTIAGIGRTLGEPWASAAPLADGPVAKEVDIVVAWEISWYRYRVDLDDADEAVVLLDRGNEVDDLDEAQRAWNIGADAEGRLALAVEAAS